MINPRITHFFPLLFVLFFISCSSDERTDRYNETKSIIKKDTLANNTKATQGISVQKQIKNSSSDSFFYEPASSIVHGILTKKFVYGPPGYGETPQQDVKDSMWIIALDRKINVYALLDSTEAEASTESDEMNVDTMQLVISRELMQQYVRKHVELKGYLFHADNANHRTNVLMEVKEVREVK